MNRSSKLKLKEYWTFRKHSNTRFTHGLHPYPARMHPEIARHIILDYAENKKTIVIDPFVGSGGVLIESMLHGNTSVGFDVNPFAVLLSKVKTTVINPNIAKQEYLRIIGKSKRDYERGKFYPELIPDGFDIKFWIKPNVIKKLSIIKHHIYNSNENTNIIDFLRICFSLTTRIVSNQRKEEYKIYRMNRVQLQSFHPNVFETFEEICERNCSLASEFRSTMKNNKTKTIVKLGNALDFSENFKKLHLDDSKGHLIMTSPPYGDHTTTVAYGQFSTHSGLWIGMDERELKGVDKIGLGGKWREDYDENGLGSTRLSLDLKEVAKKDPQRAHQVYWFFSDLDRSLEEFSKVLKPGKSHLCF